MRNIDYCRNSIFLNEDEKEFVNNKINRLFDALRSKLSAANLAVNVYLGGSLSLREPSLKFKNNQLIGINSDADLFTVVKDLADAPKVIQIFKELEDIEPDLDRSLHLVPLVKILQKTYLASIDDLLYSINEPVFEAIDTSGYYPSLELNPKTLAMLFVGCTGVAVIPYYTSNHFYCSSDNHHLHSQRFDLKMILAGLRLQVYGAVDGVHGISSIYHEINNGVFDNLLERETVVKVLELRERYTEDVHIPEIDKYMFILRAWQNKLGLPFSSSNTATILAARDYFFADQSDVCNRVVVILTTLTLCILKLSNELLELFKELVKNTFPFELSISVTLRENLLRAEVLDLNMVDLHVKLTNILLELQNLSLTLQTQKIIK